MALVLALCGGAAAATPSHVVPPNAYGVLLTGLTKGTHTVRHTGTFNGKEVQRDGHAARALI